MLIYQPKQRGTHRRVNRVPRQLTVALIPDLLIIYPKIDIAAADKYRARPTAGEEGDNSGSYGPATVGAVYYRVDDWKP